MVIPFTVGESTANVTHSAGDDALRLTIQQQAERIRELEDKKAANNALCVRRIAEVTAERNEARQQLSEVVEYAGKQNIALDAAYKHHMATDLRIMVERFGSIKDYKEFGEKTWFETVPTALALPLPKAMKGD